jgi:colanic acid/amylovoran biosynthesis protein
MSVRALILWAEPASTNLGVRALADGTSQLLHQAFSGCEVEYQGNGPGDAPVRIGSSRAQARRLMAWQNDLVDYVRTFDLVVDTRAGDSFADLYGLSRLWTMSLMTATAVRARVPIVLGPQTIGPFATARGRVLAQATLRSSTLVMARDGVSAQAAARLGRPVDVLTTDVVFALPRPRTDLTRDVVVNPSGLLWNPNPHVDHERYRTIVRDLCRALQSRGRQVSVFAHVLDSPLLDNDVPVLEQLAGEVGGLEVLVPTDLASAREMLATAQVVVGSRMHACLNALSVGRPAVPLAYSRKFEPLLEGLGWRFTVDLRQATDPVARALGVIESDGLSDRVSTVAHRADELTDSARQVLAHAF